MSFILFFSSFWEFFCKFEFISKEKKVVFDSGWTPQSSWSPWKQEVHPGSITNLSRSDWGRCEKGTAEAWTCWLTNQGLSCDGSRLCVCTSVGQGPLNGGLTRESPQKASDPPGKSTPGTQLPSFLNHH